MMTGYWLQLLSAVAAPDSQNTPPILHMVVLYLTAVPMVMLLLLGLWNSSVSPPPPQ